jgi:hypothetical protein
VPVIETLHARTGVRAVLAFAAAGTRIGARSTAARTAGTTCTSGTATISRRPIRATSAVRDIARPAVTGVAGIRAAPVLRVAAALRAVRGERSRRALRALGGRGRALAQVLGLDRQQIFAGQQQGCGESERDGDAHADQLKI